MAKTEPCRACDRPVDTRLSYFEGGKGKRCKWGGAVCDDNCERSFDRRMDASIDRHNDPRGWYTAKANLNDPHD